MKETCDIWPNWDRIFTSPEDPAWHLVLNSEGQYALSHDCPSHVPDHYEVKGCTYCGEEAPDTLWGLLNLCDWKP